MKRTMLIKLEVEESGTPREGGKEICERLESVLRINEFLADPVSVGLVSDTRAKMTTAQMIWRAAQEKVCEFLKPTFFQEIPVAGLIEVLEGCGVEEIEEFGLLLGDQGRTSKRLKVGSTEKWLQLTWYRMESGNYEVIGYLS